jgi:hypothetical protein
VHSITLDDIFDLPADTFCDDLKTCKNGLHTVDDILIPQNIFKQKPKPQPEPLPTTAGASTTSLPEQPFGLQVVHEPKVRTKIVSIVFVHGLGGSARGTWTHSPSNIFCPTLLHEDDRFASARISTFGYDANYTNVFAVKSVLGIQDFARQLLDALDLYYDKYGDDVSILDDAKLIYADPHHLCGA